MICKLREQQERDKVSGMKRSRKKRTHRLMFGVGRKIWAIVLLVSLLFSLCDGIGTVYAEKSEKSCFAGNDFEVVFEVKNSWEGGYEAEVTVRNTGEEAIENWRLEFPLQEEIDSIWNAVIDNRNSTLYTVKSMAYNQDIEAGEAVRFGFITKSSFSECPESFCLKREQSIVEEKSYSVRYVISDSWEGGFIGSIEITNESSERIEDWQLQFVLDAQIDDIWNGIIINKEDNRYFVKNVQYNQNILPGATVVFGFCCQGEAHTQKPSDMKLTQLKDGQQALPLSSATPPVQGSTEEDEEESDGEDELELTKETIGEYVSVEFAPGNTYDSVVDDIQLVNELPEELNVVWHSSKPSVISETGRVTRTGRKEKVTITAEIHYRGEQITETFELTVVGKCQTNPDQLEDFCVEQLEEMNQNDDQYDIKINDFGYVEWICGKFSEVKVESYETALMALYNIRSAMGITNPFEELQPYDAEVDETGYLFKFTQVYQGIKLFSNVVTVMADTDGNVDYFSSNYFPIALGVETTPALTYEQAVEAVKEQLGEIAIQETEEPYCMLNYYRHTDLVWEIPCVITEDRDEWEAGEYLLLVGASDGEIKYRNRTGAYAAKTQSLKVDDLEDMRGNFQSIYVEKGKSGKGDIYYLNDSTRKIRVSDRDGKLIQLGNEEDWTKEQVSAMANMEAIYDFYKDTFKRYSYNNAGTKKKGKQIKVVLDSYVMDNCNWNFHKKTLTIGDGSGTEKIFNAKDSKYKNTDYTLRTRSLAASADVMCHEFTHGIMQSDTELYKIAAGIPGAINEAYADTGACFFDKNWTIAENSVTEGSNPMRDITDPNRVGCAEKVGDKYYINPALYLSGEWDVQKSDTGGVHMNSTVLTHAVYRMNQLGISKDTLQKIWYKTIRMGYTRMANFYTVRKQFIKAAGKYGLNQYISKIEQAFNEGNVTKDSSDIDYGFYYLQADRSIFCASYFDDVQISGRVVDMQEWSPLESVEVAIYQKEGGNPLSDTVSEEEGDYELAVEPYQAYRLTFTCDGYLPEEMYLSDIDGIVQTEYYCDTVALVPEEMAGTGAASGQILDAETGKGVAGISLKLRKGINNIDSEVIGKMKTEKGGKYIFDGLEAGNYCVEIACEKDSEYISSYFNIQVLGGRTLDSQNGVVSPKLSKNQLRAVLTWGERPRDVDAHLQVSLSNGQKGHVYFSKKSFASKQKTVALLDVDDTTSYGPETITVYSGKTGQYQYFVHNYSGEQPLEDSEATVQVYMQGSAYPKYTFHVPAGEGDHWDVFVYNSATHRLAAVNVLTEEGGGF